MYRGSVGRGEGGGRGGSEVGRGKVRWVQGTKGRGEG